MENAVSGRPLPPEEGEVFRRVWERVMGEGREDCPITVEAVPLPLSLGGDVPCTCVCPVPAPPVFLREERHVETDFPEEEDVPCLGHASAPYAPQLQRQTADALECHRLYRALAARVGSSPCSRALALMAGEQLRGARRLAAAHFLISGVRWWPGENLTQPRISSLQGTLRDCFRAEQLRARAYEEAAADTADRALEELYGELSLQAHAHAAAIRAVVEQLRP